MGSQILSLSVEFCHSAPEARNTGRYLVSAASRSSEAATQRGAQSRHQACYLHCPGTGPPAVATRHKSSRRGLAGRICHKHGREFPCTPQHAPVRSPHAWRGESSCNASGPYWCASSLISAVILFGVPGLLLFALRPVLLIALFLYILMVVPPQSAEAMRVMVQEHLFQSLCAYMFSALLLITSMWNYA